MAQAECQQLSVLMFPWLAHGHSHPYLELAKRLTSVKSRDTDRHVDVIVHFVSTPVNLAAMSHHQSTTLRLVELHLPVLPDLPPALHTTKHLPTHLMLVLKRACDLAASRFGALLDAIRPDVILFDFLQTWAPIEAASRGIPAVHFSTCSATATGFFIHCLQNAGAPTAFPFEAISLGGAEADSKYTALLSSGDDGTGLIPERERLPRSLASSTGFIAVKTCADIERKYIDYLSKLVGKEIVPCGPLLVDSGAEPHLNAGSEPDRVMRWLDRKDPGSVLLSSFGSEYFMSEHQMTQMANGLELSGASFIWVVRFPKRPDENHGAARALPRGFAPERGLVVEGWAPQRRILSHASCGAFLTHCGWSSVLEAMAAGVPMVALPLHIDQPLNANLAAEAGVAVRVPQERFGEFKAEDVARVARGVLCGSEREPVRRRSKEMQKVVVRNDGDRQGICDLLERLARLCGKGQAEEEQTSRSAVAN